MDFSNSTSIDTEGFAKGIYIYEIKSKDEGMKMGKVVKQ
jgi:hypothetical protein